MSSAPPHAPDGDLGSFIRHRRTQLGLSIRSVARALGISPGYLVSIELGRNPTTGRPPQPSPNVLAAIGRVFAIDVSLLLELAGVGTTRPRHVLLYQTGDGSQAPLAAARALFAGRVDAWIEIVDPRRPQPRADPADVLRQRGPLGYADEPGAPRFDGPRALAALAPLVDRAPPAALGVGLVLGANSALLRAVEDPGAVLASEATWERDVERVLQESAGTAVAANVCVYAETDILEIGDRVDPLAAVVALIEAHPTIAVQDDAGSVTTGPVAIETILAAVRPRGVSAGTWGSLARAASLGLARTAAGS